MSEVVEFRGYIEHIKTREIYPYYKETEAGFLWIVPFRAAGFGIAGPPAYLLKKPYWRKRDE